MPKVLTARNAIALAVILGVGLLAYWAAPDAAAPSQSEVSEAAGASPGNDWRPGPWYGVLPPLLAVTLAIVTGRILISLALAIVIGGFLSTVPEAPGSLGAWAWGIVQGPHYVWISLDSADNLWILAFVTLVLAMVSVVIASGGLHGIVMWLGRFARGPRSAQFVTFLMGLVVFIDDYANTMIVGSAMRPVTDKLKVSREKLAFIVDATSAPIAGLAIVSTWVGYEVGLFQEQAVNLQIDTTGYAMLFDALVFRFYCVLMVCFVFVNIVSGRDFGPMRRAEGRARKTGAVAAEDAVPMTSKAFSASIPHPDSVILARTGLIPIAGLFIFILAAIWHDGGGTDRLRESLLSAFSLAAWREVIGASQNSITILAYAGAFSLGLAIVCAAVLSKTRLSVIASAVLSGAKGSLLPIVILVLAWSLKAACDDLRTGEFLVAIVRDKLPMAWFPGLTFIIAALTSFATGTSYGTMGILIPIAVPIAYTLEGGYGLITVITLAACLDGSIVGDHCSPISDTTIMSSISSSCDHLHHVRTQLPYSLTVGGLALVCGYFPAGFGVPSWVGILAAVGLTGVLFYLVPESRAEDGQDAPEAE